MPSPVVVPRAEHTLSRRQIDPDALKVLYRLHQNGYVAYLVGGSVRDLLLGREPKDFDIGTSAHPYQVKRLFRNCWIIGRRFRLAHVRFGPKNVEVATFRRHVTEAESAGLAQGPEGAAPADERHDTRGNGPGGDSGAGDGGTGDARADREAADRLIHRDNTFGTPEEDAFRRDFTINALFYDIGTFSIIDYTGGLEDLKTRIVRCIGDPRERFEEDPVRMLRAIAMAARLDFRLDQPIVDAIAAQRQIIDRSAPARVMEELYKLLRTGSSLRAFEMLAEHGLLEPLAPELQAGATDAMWRSLAALDTYRRRFVQTPETLTNAILLGSLIVPLGGRLHPPPLPPGADPRKEPRLSLGMLPLARRDVERLRQILSLQRRLTDTELSPRARRTLIHRGPFAEALTWLEIHGHAPEIVEHWRGFVEAATVDAPVAEEPEGGEKRRRSRRRRRRRPVGTLP